MKSEAIIVLKESGNPKEQFNALMVVFLKEPTHSPQTANFLNRSGYSKINLKTLIYEVKKLLKITDIEIHQSNNTVVSPVINKLSNQERLLSIDFEKISPEDLEEAVVDLKEFSDFETLIPVAIPAFEGFQGYNEMKDFVKNNKIESQSLKKVDLKKGIYSWHEQKRDEAFNTAVLQLQSAQQELKTVQSNNDVVSYFDAAPEEVKTNIKLRDEFPFLNEEDCPDKLKVLVSDKLTAYNNYVSARKDIQEKIENGNADEVFNLAKKAVENFELNLEIYDELNYYKENGELLMNHDIFSNEKLKEKVAAYKEKDLSGKRGNLRTYVSRDSKKLDTMEQGEKKDALSSKIESWNLEITLITERLGDKK